MLGEGKMTRRCVGNSLNMDETCFRAKQSLGAKYTSFRIEIRESRGTRRYKVLVLNRSFKYFDLYDACNTNTWCLLLKCIMG